MTGTQDQRPRHEQIAAHLRDLIMSGDLPSGTQLPSTAQLVAQYQAANATIQRALSALKAEGFVRSEVGRGVYVRDRRPTVVRVAAYKPVSPGGYRYQLLDVRTVQPPLSVAEGFGGADRAILRKRVMTLGGESVELSWSYYPIDIAAGTPLAGKAKIPGGAPRVLAELGYPERWFADRVCARPPTTEEVETLGLPTSMPIIRQFRVIYSDHDRPVEVSIGVKGAHLHEVEYRETVMTSEE